MLIGHYAPALLLKTARPRIPLWMLFLAVQAVDILWACFILTGIEHVRIIPGFNESNALDLYDMPVSHSLVATGFWSVLFGLLASRLWHSFPARRQLGMVIAIAVASHFVLDLLVHVPDLPLAGASSPKLGFGLWNSRLVAVIVETGLFAGAALVLTRSRDWRAHSGRGWPVLAVAMTILCVAGYFIPAPPTPTALAISGLLFFLGLAWAARSVESRES